MYVRYGGKGGFAKGVISERKLGRKFIVMLDDLSLFILIFPCVGGATM